MNARTDLPPWEREAPPEIAHLRVPPHSVEAEQAVLGGLLLDNSAWDRIADLLTEADFYRHEHRRIFAAVAALVTANRPADVITVFGQLRTDKPEDDCGGMAYLNALAESVPSGRNARRYAEIVREKAIARAMVAKADEIATAAFRGDTDVGEQLVKAAASFDDLIAARGRGGPREAGEIVVQRLDHISAVANGEKAIGFPTGLKGIDEALNGGLQEGRVYVLAARPSVGKTALALQIGLHQARRLDRAVLVLSQEMPGEEVIDRALSNVGGIDYGRLQRGELDDGDWVSLSSASEVLGKIPLWIDDQPALTLRDIRAKALSLRQKGLKTVVVDYLQLCAGQTQGKGINRNTELAELTGGLKTLARQLRLSIVLLSQLSRDVEKRSTAEPTLADLRDSGAIEQDADVVLGLWVVQHWSKSLLMSASVLKNRQGERGQRIALEFFGRYQQFVDNERDINDVMKPAKTKKEDFE